MFPLWARFGVTMTICWIKTCAVSLVGGVDAGKVGPEGVVLVFEDGGAGVTVETSMQAPTATQQVKYHPRQRGMYHR